jgi:hypothetical protein
MKNVEKIVVKKKFGCGSKYSICLGLKREHAQLFFLQNILMNPRGNFDEEAPYISTAAAQASQAEQSKPLSQSKSVSAQNSLGSRLV